MYTNLAHNYNEEIANIGISRIGADRGKGAETGSQDAEKEKGKTKGADTGRQGAEEATETGVGARDKGKNTRTL